MHKRGPGTNLRKKCMSEAAFVLILNIVRGSAISDFVAGKCNKIKSKVTSF